MINELLAYNESKFKHPDWTEGRLPIPDEPFVATWLDYLAEVMVKGVYPVLKGKLVQLQFPISQGISQSESYLAATRRGTPVEQPPGNSGLMLECPEKLELYLYPTLAGRLPVLQTPHRPDFIALVQALSRRNEPIQIPDSMGACMVKGYNNWDRLRTHKKIWQQQNPSLSEAHWQQEFRKIIPQKELYQDKFMILSNGCYSGVPAQQLGLTETEWQNLSLIIRCEHEATHYFTQRVLGSARNHIFDELIADYMGLVAATGQYQAHWFLTFLGLENYPHYRSGGRLENYQGNPPLSGGAFKILQTIVKKAAENLQRITEQNTIDLSTDAGKLKILLTLTRSNLIELAVN